MKGDPVKKTVLAACAALTLVGIVGCGSDEPGSDAGGSDGQRQSDQRQSDDDGSNDLELGKTAELIDTDKGSTFDVTVSDVRDPSENLPEQAPQGTRYVSAVIEVSNTGRTDVEYASFDDGIELRTDDNRIYRADSELSGPVGEQAEEPETIAPGDTVERRVVFLVDRGKEPAEIGLNSTSPFTEDEVGWDLEDDGGQRDDRDEGDDNGEQRDDG